LSVLLAQYCGTLAVGSLPVFPCTVWIVMFAQLRLPCVDLRGVLYQEREAA